MRNLLALIAALAILFAAVGGVRGWYTVQWMSAGGGRAAFLVEVDAYRFAGDVVQAGRSAADGINRLFAPREKAAESAGE
ncbi:MAG: hypothetical protein U0736_25200 [Gemmataceae bacterium]